MANNELPTSTHNSAKNYLRKVNAREIKHYLNGSALINKKS